MMYKENRRDEEATGMQQQSESEGGGEDDIRGDSYEGCAADLKLH